MPGAQPLLLIGMIMANASTVLDPESKDDNFMINRKLQGFDQEISLEVNLKLLVNRLKSNSKLLVLRNFDKFICILLLNNILLAIKFLIYSVLFIGSKAFVHLTTLKKILFATFRPNL